MDDRTDRMLSDKELIALNFVGILAEAIMAWQEFKKGHDIEALHINCCEVTTAFHQAMNALEAEVIGQLGSSAKKGG